MPKIRSWLVLLLLLCIARQRFSVEASNSSSSSSSSSETSDAAKGPNCTFVLFPEPAANTSGKSQGSAGDVASNSTLQSLGNSSQGSTQGNQSHPAGLGNSSAGNSSLSDRDHRDTLEDEGCPSFVQQVICPEYSTEDINETQQTCHKVDWSFCCEPQSQGEGGLWCCSEIEDAGGNDGSRFANETNSSQPCTGQTCPSQISNNTSNQCSVLDFNSTWPHPSCLQGLLECRTASQCTPFDSANSTGQYNASTPFNSSLMRSNFSSGGNSENNSSYVCDDCCSEHVCPLTRGIIRCCAVEHNASVATSGCPGVQVTIRCTPAGFDLRDRSTSTTSIFSVESTPFPDDDESVPPIIYRENLTIINITSIITEIVEENATDYDGGLNEELERLVNAFRDPGTFLFQAEGLDPESIYILWTTFAIFMLMTFAIAYDRSRYKIKHQSNHNLLLLIAIISCMCYLTMANGHGRVWRHIITDVTPRDLTRFCNRTGELTPINDTAGESQETFCEGGTIVYRWLSADANFELVPLNPPFFYGKYLQWLFTTNITLYLLCVSVANAKIRVTIFVLVCNTMMILCGLLAASMRTEGVDSLAVPRFVISRWVYWVCGMMFYVLLLSVLNRAVRRAANSRRSRPQNVAIFNQMFFVLCLGWSLYPFAWTVTEGFSALSFRTQTYTFSILDVANKLVFTVLFLLRVPQSKHMAPGSKPSLLMKVVQPCMDEVPTDAANQELGSMNPQERRENRHRAIRTSRNLSI